MVQIVRANIPIPEIPHGEDLWLILLVTSVRRRRTQQGRLYYDVSARNATGSIFLRLWGDVAENQAEMKPGLWAVKGKLETFQERAQFVVAEYRSTTIEKYREHQNAEPQLPRAFTLDIETLTLPDFRERVGPQLERQMRLGNMRVEQQQRYLEDIAAEEERCYALGALSATSGRVLSLAVHVGPIPGLEFPGLGPEVSEHAFGIDTDGFEQPEKRALLDFLALMKDFDCDCDELVGHNVIGFDLPFIFQRCLVHGIEARPFVNLAEYNVRGVFDTMHRWWLGAKRHVSLDDVAWALGIESSKTAEVEGSKVFDLYQAGKLDQIREYNLNDVRVTRKVYERMVASFGR
jgi:DNA polymerase elongation subunit (family B)